MSDRHVIETLLRPAVELNSASVAMAAGYICIAAPWAVALTPSIGYGMAAGFFILALYRARQGLYILRYRRNIRRLPRYQIDSTRIPISRQFLFIGRGFRWEQ